MRWGDFLALTAKGLIILDDDDDDDGRVVTTSEILIAAIGLSNSDH